MRTIEVDQFEFDQVDGEEHLEIATARRSEWMPNIAVFARSVGYQAADAPPMPKGQIDIIGYLTRSAPTLPDPSPLCELRTYSEVLDYLRRFAGIEAPEPCRWLCWQMPMDDRYIEENLLIETNEGFISYKWSSSA